MENITYNSKIFLRNLQKFRLITFDITETLLRFKRAPAIEYAKTAAKFGIMDIDQPLLEAGFKSKFKLMATKHPNFGRNSIGWREWWSQLVQELFHFVKPNLDAGQLKLLTEALIRVYRTNVCWDHMEGNRELLWRVRDANKRIGVISNSDPSLDTVLKAMDLKNQFDFVLTSYEANHQKPHKGIFDIALTKSNNNIRPHEALHIGNLYDVDYMGARNAGWHSLLITRNENDYKKVPSTHAYPDLKELLIALNTIEIEW